MFHSEVTRNISHNFTTLSSGTFNVRWMCQISVVIYFSRVLKPNKLKGRFIEISWIFFLHIFKIHVTSFEPRGIHKYWVNKQMEIEDVFRQSIDMMCMLLPMGQLVALFIIYLRVFNTYQVYYLALLIIFI